VRDMTPNLEEAVWALTEKPMFATSVERFQIYDELKSSYRELPQPLRFSKIFSILLSRVSVPLEAHDLIAGRCVDRELSDGEEAAFQAYLKHPDRLSKSCVLAAGHCTFSWEALVSEGLVGLRAQAEQTRAGTEDADKQIFLSAMIEVYDAIIAYLLRYAEAAEAFGLCDVAENLRLAATTRPDRFSVALQLLWTVAMLNCSYVTRNPTLTVGRLDQMLYPLYAADLASGRLTRDGAAAYITDYYCKHNLIMGRGEHQVGDAQNSTTFERIYCFDAPQYLMLAGTDRQGKLAVNELTELFASCIVPSFKNPVIVVRYVKGMDEACPALWKTLCEKARASASMMFYNDDNMLAAWRRIGLDAEDLPDYTHFGCNWPSPGDKGHWMQIGPRSERYGVYQSEEEKRELCIPFMRSNSPHSWPEDFLEIMRALAEKEPKGVTIEDFYEQFFARMSDFMDRKLSHHAHELSVRRRRPAAILTFGDCFLWDSIQNAECFSAGAKYHYAFLSFQMFGTVADCFIAVDQLVMREKRVTLRELLAAVDANFEGYESILALCRKADKYGMDTPLSNAHVHRLSHTFCDMVMEKNRPYFEKDRLFLTPCMQSDTWHLKMGEDFGATPDGRLAHTPFSQNTRPSNGACVNGLTAMFNSMLQLPQDGLLSGALNLDVDAKQFAGDAGGILFSKMLAAYFNAGGLHAQVTCADLRKLLDAQKNPHSHRDLRVRVTGYSGVFVDICERLQNDIIERMK